MSRLARRSGFGGSGFVGLAVALFAAACASAGPAAEARPEVVAEGLFLVIYGDPVGPSGSPGYLFTLSESSGVTHQVVPDSAAGVTAEALRVFDRERVRAVGIFRPGPGGEFVVSAMESVSGRLSAPRAVPNIQ